MSEPEQAWGVWHYLPSNQKWIKCFQSADSTAALDYFESHKSDMSGKEILELRGPGCFPVQYPAYLSEDEEDWGFWMAGGCLGIAVLIIILSCLAAGFVAGLMLGQHR